MNYEVFPWHLHSPTYVYVLQYFQDIMELFKALSKHFIPQFFLGFFGQSFLYFS